MGNFAQLLFNSPVKERSSRNQRNGGNCYSFNLSTLETACSPETNIQFLLNLSRIFYEQLRSCTVMLYFGMQFIYVIGHGKHQDFCSNFLVPSEQELAKSIVLFNDSKSTFRLNGAVHSQPDPFWTGNSFQRCSPLSDEFLGNLKFTVSL